MFWSIGARPISHTFELSGSSITTLGFHTTDNHWELALAVPEGLIGIGLVALLISYLPSIYNLFRERETMCTGWNIRAGSPPTVAVVVRRFNEIGILESMEDTWKEWEKWFVSNEEVTLSYPALAFFRSPTPHQSWVTTAGNVLDTAAFIETAVKVPHSPSSHLCLQAGYVALRRIAENYDADFDQDPSPDDPISIPRHEFEEVCDQLAAEGVPIEEDRDTAWREFSGWRVNYDVPLRLLCQIVLAPYAQWSSDYVDSVHGRRQFRFKVRELIASQWWYRVSGKHDSDEEAVHEEVRPGEGRPGESKQRESRPRESKQSNSQRSKPDPAMKTRITELLGVEIPVIQAPMGYIARAQLASAVSNAGGLGIVETSSGQLDDVKEEFAKMRDLTDKPWGVNIAQMLVRDMEEIVDFVASQHIKVVTTSAGDPRVLTEELEIGRHLRASCGAYAVGRAAGGRRRGGRPRGGRHRRRRFQESARGFHDGAGAYDPRGGGHSRGGGRRHLRRHRHGRSFGSGSRRRADGHSHAQRGRIASA